MNIQPETLALFTTVSERIAHATQIVEDAISLLEPIVEEALKRDDPDELNELVRLLPSSFWRAEIRGHLMLTGRYQN